MFIYIRKMKVYIYKENIFATLILNVHGSVRLIFLGYPWVLTPVNRAIFGRRKKKSCQWCLSFKHSCFLHWTTVSHYTATLTHNMPCSSFLFYFFTAVFLCSVKTLTVINPTAVLKWNKFSPSPRDYTVWRELTFTISLSIILMSSRVNK